MSSLLNLKAIYSDFSAEIDSRNFNADVSVVNFFERELE